MIRTSFGVCDRKGGCICAAPVTRKTCTHRRAAKPKLLIIGHARHGKDTFAEMLRDRHGYTFQSSSLFAAEHVVRPALAKAGVTYASLDDCYADRVNHRAFWFDTIAAYNEPDPASLAAAILETADIYVGMRSEREYQAARPLFDAVVWVDASRRGKPPEPAASMTISYDRHSMWWIDNGGSLADLARASDDFARCIARN